MSKINAVWHRAHPMPKNPTLDQRIEWHLAHARHCACRQITGKLRGEIIRRGIDPAALTAQRQRREAG